MLPPGVKIYIATNALDMRKSLDGMSAIVNQTLKKNVFQGIYLFFGNSPPRRPERSEGSPVVWHI
jgi:transposase